jgi:predicted TIM-barrel fold metal-dependent hydrolase
VTRVWGEDAALLDGLGLDTAALAALERGALGATGLPADARVVDAHVHLGRDRDGHHLDAEGLLADLDRHSIDAAVCFPPDDPGDDGQFSLANWAVARTGERSAGRVIPFCRVDPRRPGAAEAMDRAAEAGARGLKLHPVAQRFRPEDPATVLLVRAAAARGWPVLIHAGFGARALAEPIAALADAAPRATLILAHGGRGDARALAAVARSRPRIMFDTSLAALADLVALPPERLCFGSDRPYGEHASALALVGAAARVAGWSETQTRAVLGGNLRRILDAGA